MVIDNSKEKERLNKQISAIKTSLEEHFSLKTLSRLCRRG